MGQELRTHFHQQLAEIDQGVVRLFALVSDGVAAATDSLLASDAAVAQRLAQREGIVDRLELELEEVVEHQLLTQSPMSGDMRFLVTVLRIVPQLERCADLANHVGNRGRSGVAARLTPELRNLLAGMADRCVAMWREAGVAWSDRDDGAAARLEAADDELDRDHDELMAALPVADVAPEDLMQATLVGRFYERLGDHAVHIAERIGYVTSGRHRTHDPIV